MICRTQCACLLVTLASFLIVACKKDKVDGDDAAADAAPLVVIADAAAEAEAEAPAASASASATPLVPPPVAARPTPKPDPPICAQARSARSRNSPVAPKLEAACKAAGGTP